MKVFPLALVTILTLANADAQEALPPKLKSVPTYAALATAATTNRIPISGFDHAIPTNLLCAGDSVTILGTMITKEKKSQWLLYIEGKSRAPNTTNPPPMVVHLSTGKISFPSRPVPAHLRMLGPCADSDGANFKFQEQTADLTLNESFLGLGLNDAAAIIWRRHQSSNGTTPNPQPGKVDKKFTPEEQRAMAGAISTITSYLEIVKHTEGLEDLLAKLIKKPSVWSVVRHLGVTVNLFFGDKAFPANPADWDLPPGTPVFYIPCSLRLNDQPALKITMVATKPNPPRLICGGVIGLLAEKPGDNETYMTLRVISARRGAESPSHDQNELNQESANK